MIYIDRKAAQVPKIFESQKAKSARKEAEEFFSLPKSKRSQQRLRSKRRYYRCWYTLRTYPEMCCVRKGRTI
ncbi:hypothetical protein ES703_64436 [subsurface metagenome]